MVLIGITGTNGSGKGTVVDYLVNEKKFAHYAARDFITREIERRGMPVDRSSMRLVANELRERHDPAYVIRSLYEEAVAHSEEHAVIESIRNVGEAEFLASKNALLIAVDADQKLRFERVQARRSATDKVDFETFVEHEEREMRPVGPHDMDVRGVMALADVTIENNGSLEDLHTHIEHLLEKMSV